MTIKALIPILVVMILATVVSIIISSIFFKTSDSEETINTVKQIDAVFPELKKGTITEKSYDYWPQIGIGE